jgi:hypothetical protein
MKRALITVLAGLESHLPADSNSDCGVPGHVIMAVAAGFANETNMDCLHHYQNHNRIDGQFQMTSSA